MKWLALLLVLSNAVVWWVANREAPPADQVQGQLPRVASIKLGPEEAGQYRCMRVGWFETKEEAKQLAERSGLVYFVEERERTLSPLNWVLIPPQPERAALDQLGELRREGVEAWLVTQGEYRNAISLGLFESRSAAETVVAEKKRKNLDVVLAKFTRNRIGYALVFEVEPKAESLPVQAVEAESGKKFEINEPAPCKGIATPDKNP
jgi:hypothetical protein